MPTVTLFDKPTRLTTFRAHNAADETVVIDLDAGGELIARIPVAPGGYATFYGSAGLPVAAPLVVRHGGPDGSLEVSTATDDVTSI